MKNIKPELSWNSMINKFEIINEKIEVISIYPNDSQYSFDDELRVIYHAKYRGIRWVSDKHTITMLDKSYNIQGCPTEDLETVVVLKTLRYGEYSPTQAYIYHENGEIYKKLEIPKLISDLSKKYYNRSMFPNGISFDSVKKTYWREKNEYVISIRFSFGAIPMYEDRVLYIKTGEFGECIDSGYY